MKIGDIIDKLPCKVKLNNNFTLDESFDSGTIVFVKSCEIEEVYEGEACYKVYVSALKEDLEYNTSISIHDWRNPKNDQYELNFYEVNKITGDFEDTIYVMENDDCFDLVEPKLTIDSKMVSDIEKLIDGVLLVSPTKYEYTSECPYCKKSCSWNDSMFDVEHESDCIYVLAQELSKRFNND